MRVRARVRMKMRVRVSITCKARVVELWFKRPEHAAWADDDRDAPI